MAGLKLEEVNFSFAHPLWRGLNAAWPEGGHWGLTGPNGSGKSTLLRLLAGWLPWQSGRASLGGETLNGLPPESRSLVLLSSRSRLYSHWNVRQNLAFPARCQQLPDLSGDLLEELQLQPLAQRRVEELSAGEVQRVVWARALNRQASWLLADEALNHLDGPQRTLLWQCLRRRKVSLLLVTHQLEQDLPWLDGLTSLEQGVLHPVNLDRLLTHPPTLWLAQQTRSEWVWPASLLGLEGSFWWIPPQAWLPAEETRGWPVIWGERRGPSRRVDILGRSLWLPDQPECPRLDLDRGQIQPLGE